MFASTHNKTGSLLGNLGSLFFLTAINLLIIFKIRMIVAYSEI
jgi:hypothetical protein